MSHKLGNRDYNANLCSRSSPQGVQRAASSLPLFGVLGVLAVAAVRYPLHVGCLFPARTRASVVLVKSEIHYQSKAPEGPFSFELGLWPLMGYGPSQPLMARGRVSTPAIVTAVERALQDPARVKGTRQLVQDMLSDSLATADSIALAERLVATVTYPYRSETFFALEMLSCRVGGPRGALRTLGDVEAERAYQEVLALDGRARRDDARVANGFAVALDFYACRLLVAPHEKSGAASDLPMLLRRLVGGGARRIVVLLAAGSSQRESLRASVARAPFASLPAAAIDVVTVVRGQPASSGEVAPPWTLHTWDGPQTASATP